MKKEIIICICIIIFVILIDFFTQNYSKKTIDKITDDLSFLKEELISIINQEKFKQENNNNKKDDNIKQITDDITNEFDNKYEILAYYIEHDELEKVETELTTLRAYIEEKEYKESLPDLDKIVFILNHIKEKTNINLKNIF